VHLPSASTLTFSELGSAQNPGAVQKVVVLDAGHGGEDPGTLTSYAVEKEVTLAVTLKLKALLEQEGIQVVLTRDKDSYPSLEERLRKQQQTRISLFRFMLILLKAVVPEVSKRGCWGNRSSLRSSLKNMVAVLAGRLGLK
jgi:hypothetical protein